MDSPTRIYLKVGWILILYEILVFSLTFDLKCVFHALCLWALSQAQEDCSGNSSCS